MYYHYIRMHGQQNVKKIGFEELNEKIATNSGTF